MVSSVQGGVAWREIVALSQTYEGAGIGPRVDTLTELLGVNAESKFISKLKSMFKLKSKYKKDKWMMQIPVALEELKKEGHRVNLGL